MEGFATVEEALEELRNGKLILVTDDEDRENEGDLIIAAEKITSEKVNFMLKHARGVLCAPITVSRCKELDLPHQVTDNTSVLGTPFTVTIDKLEGCTTGVCSRPCCNHSGTGRSAFHSGYFRSPRTYQSFVCAGERGITSCWAYRSYD